MATLISKPSLSLSIKGLDVGEEMIFKNSKFRSMSVRGTVRKINEKTAMQFGCSERGIPDGIKVWRIK